MTTFDPSDRDEIVAAYLDGEATSEERASVEADPELLARVEVMREIASMVAEPVPPPSDELRAQHISRALAASATAPNVTALAPRRRRWSGNLAVVASAAAIIAIALLAVPLLLLSAGDSDDDSVATSAATDDGDSALDDAIAAAPAEEPAEEPAEAAAELSQADEDAATDDGLAADDMADDGGEEAAEEPAAEGAEEPPANDAAGGDGLLFRSSRTLVAPELPDIEALADEVRDLLSDAQRDAPTADEIGFDLVCEPTFADAGVDGEVALVGEAVVAGQAVEHVTFDGPEGPILVVVNKDTCAVIEIAMLS